MTLFVFLNELSFEPCSEDFEDARRRMSEFLATFRELTSQFTMLGPALRIREEIEQSPLAKAYSIADWLNDPSVQRDEKSRFRLLSTKYPLVQDEEFPEAHDKGLGCAVLYNGREGLGLKSAYLCQQLAISLNQASPWDSVQIPCLLQELVEQQGVGIQERPIEVKHISSMQALASHEEWFQELLLEKVNSSSTLWEMREEFFPQLEFCRETEKQLKHLDPVWLRPVFNSLIELNRAYKEWNWEGVIPDTIGKKVTPESNRTLDEFAEEHTFSRSNGESILFDWHLRFTPGAGRIFFYSHHEDRRCIIGHIGGKLPNATY